MYTTMHRPATCRPDREMRHWEASRSKTWAVAGVAASSLSSEIGASVGANVSLQADGSHSDMHQCSLQNDQQRHHCCLVRFASGLTHR